MNRETFIERKANLINMIKASLAKEYISEQDRISLIKILESLNQYSFENRMIKKGLLSRMIIDSLELDYALGEKIIKFDNDIK